MVHLSVHAGSARSSSMSLARLLSAGSWTKAVTRSGVGMRPVRSRVTRRMNSQSVVFSAGVMLLAWRSAQMFWSMRLALPVAAAAKDLARGWDALVWEVWDEVVWKN